MPAMVKRRVIKPSDTSAYIVIPKPYRDFHKIDKGSKVTILYDNLLLVIPEGLEEKVLSDPEKRRLIEKLLR